MLLALAQCLPQQPLAAVTASVAAASSIALKERATDVDVVPTPPPPSDEDDCLHDSCPTATANTAATTATLVTNTVAATTAIIATPIVLRLLHTATLANTFTLTAYYCHRLCIAERGASSPRGVHHLVQEEVLEVVEEVDGRCGGPSGWLMVAFHAQVRGTTCWCSICPF